MAGGSAEMVGEEHQRVIVCIVDVNTTQRPGENARTDQPVTNFTVWSQRNPKLCPRAERGLPHGDANDIWSGPQKRRHWFALGPNPEVQISPVQHVKRSFFEPEFRRASLNRECVLRSWNHAGTALRRLSSVQFDCGIGMLLPAGQERAPDSNQSTKYPARN